MPKKLNLSKKTFRGPLIETKRRNITIASLALWSHDHLIDIGCALNSALDWSFYKSLRITHIIGATRSPETIIKSRNFPKKDNIGIMLGRLLIWRCQVKICMRIDWREPRPNAGSLKFDATMHVWLIIFGPRPPNVNQTQWVPFLWLKLSLIDKKRTSTTPISV